MEVEECVSIDELYEKVKGYDLVLTVEASLADALNNRQNKPRLGKLADTPKRYVRVKVPGGLMNDQTLFLEVVRVLKIDWKVAKLYIDNIFDHWKETGDIDKITDYDQFNNKNVKKIIEIIKNSNHVFTEMSKFKVKGTPKIAVLNFYQFNELDKKILPENYDVIPPFKEEKIELPEFKVFKSGSEIVQILSKNINEDNCNNVGIIVDPISKFNLLIKSSLKAAGIPIKEKSLINSDLNLRTFILLIKTALKFDSLLLRDLQPFLTHFGIKISIKFNQELITKLEIKNKLLDKFITFLESISGDSYKNVLKKFEGFRRSKVEVISDLLKTVKFNDVAIDEDNINNLEYFINTFKISAGKASGGVLLVSPGSVAYVDRPLLFFIGMDTTWTKTIIEKPWSDVDKFKELHLNNFKILLQSGERQYYLVQEKQMNEKIVPCYNFNEITAEKIEGFTDLPHKIYTESAPKIPVKSFKKQDYGDKIKEVLSVSQSDLNKFVQCPRDYMFSKLITGEDSFYMRRGTLFHDFAEFYLNYVDFVEKTGLQAFYDLILEDLLRFKADIFTEQTRTDVIYGVDELTKYIREKLDSGTLKEIEMKGYEKLPRSKNFFSEKFGKPIKTTITEMYFEDPRLGVRGIVDLIQGVDDLLDYKSGRKIKLKAMLDSSRVTEAGPVKPNYQAILYLIHLRKVTPNSPLEFTFFYFLNNFKDQLAGSPDPEENLVTIRYFPTFKEFILHESTYSKLAEARVRAEALRADIINYDKYKEILGTEDITDDLMRDSNEYDNLKDKLCKFAITKRSAPKTLRKAIVSALNELINMRRSIFLKRELDVFNENLKVWLEEINHFKKSKFPIGEINLDKSYVDRSLMYYGND